MGADELIKGKVRYCLYLLDVPPAQLRMMPLVMQLIDAVRVMRMKSKKPATRKLAATPTNFELTCVSERTYLVVPEVSSEYLLALCRLSW